MPRKDYLLDNDNLGDSNRALSGLPDGCGFWRGTAAVLAALGAISITIAVAEYHPPWRSAWFIAGAVVCALGSVAMIWALVLYLAHREAGKHWCPDARAHDPEAEHG